eukprot:TRINITY_DN13506_c0_g1_i1.p1 TRINITY_DN13506_c0_g1~~TRINITY_DN13506_c0_g1_i1.p1  ORF type:complete len:688 (-),score=121.77 TRINITY_DN13506_c0_g1_i1:80-2035(-)
MEEGGSKSEEVSSQAPAKNGSHKPPPPPISIYPEENRLDAADLSRQSSFQSEVEPQPPAEPAGRSDVVPEDLRERWRAVLMKCNQEYFKELAVESAEGSRSFDRVAQDVADRILGELPEEMFQSRGSSKMAWGADRREPQPPPKLLDDLSAVPWCIWVEDEPASRNSASFARQMCSQAGRRTQSEEIMDHRRFVCSSASDFNGVVESKDGGSALQRERQQSTASASDSQTRRRYRCTMVAGLHMRSATHPHTWMAWESRPQTVLLVGKPGDAEVSKKMREIAIWLDSQGATVVVEPSVLMDIRGETQRDAATDDGSVKICWCSSNCSCQRMKRAPASPKRPISAWKFDEDFVAQDIPDGFAERCRTFSSEDDLESAIDLLVCLGGDGTLCWAAGLFKSAMPPVLAFAGGSLGFLTPFPMSDWMKAMVPIVGANLRKQEMAPIQLVCRTRLQLSIKRASSSKSSSDDPPSYMKIQAMNEVLVHRGASGHLVKLDVWVNRTPITMVQGDGLILATPTGSTAYSLAAGGSMVHPSVPGVILTPVCPHSLSFRPVVLPDSATVTVKVPRSARNALATLAVDGKDLVDLGRGDCVEVSVSPYPLATICRASETDDWFRSVNEALQWNLRREQKELAAGFSNSDGRKGAKVSKESRS